MEVMMPAKPQAEAVSSAEDFVRMPWDTGGESAEDAGRSLFDAMESEGADLDDLDQPGDDEPPAGEAPAQSDDEDADGLEEEDLEDSDEEDLKQPESDDEGADESDDEDAEGDASEAELVEVTLPGGEKTEVTLDELRAGYSRTADYTRKRQRDASEHAEAMESLRGIRETYDTKLGKLDEVLQSLGPQKPDPELRQKNPGEYAAQKAEYEDFQAQLAAVGTERGMVDEERQQDLLKIRQEILVGEQQKLLDAIPEWRTEPQQADADLADLAQFLEQSYGFSKEQLASVVDHRLILLAREAMGARKRTASARKKLDGKKKQTRRVPAGARKRRTEADPEAKRMRKRLAQGGGSMREHARLLELELGDDL